MEENGVRKGQRKELGKDEMEKINWVVGKDTSVLRGMIYTRMG